MSDRRWLFWLSEILESVDAIRSFTAGMSQETFMANRMARDATAMNIAAIGEAVAHIPLSVTSEYPSIPWRDVKDMRNLIAHDYPGIDWSLVWKTVQNRLADLERQIIEIQKKEVD